MGDNDNIYFTVSLFPIFLLWQLIYVDFEVLGHFVVKSKMIIATHSWIMPLSQLLILPFFLSHPLPDATSFSTIRSFLNQITQNL